MYSAPTDLNVSILPVYDAPPDVTLGEDEYRAASLLTLSCQVTGATGTVSYQWSSNCSGDCFFSGDNANADTTAQNISTSFRGNVDNMFDFFLHSADAGTYTCEATDGSGNTGSGSREVRIVGKLPVLYWVCHSLLTMPSITTSYDDDPCLY